MAHHKEEAAALCWETTGSFSVRLLDSLVFASVLLFFTLLFTTDKKSLSVFSSCNVSVYLGFDVEQQVDPTTACVLVINWPLKSLFSG